ncbi:MAG: sulfotransferase [Idiomarina sp.]
MTKKIFILGVQKSGTSAVAGLLAKTFSRDVTLDLVGAIGSSEWQLAVKYGLLPFSEFVDSHSDAFQPPIIKEPCLTFFYDELRELYPEAHYLLVLRHPYEVIRSTLQRLRIPGYLNAIEFDEWDELNKTKAWRLCLDSSWLGRPVDNYVEALAMRWQLSTEICHDMNNITVIKYEDFVKDKAGFIQSLGRELNLGESIIEGVDYSTQFQPKGKSVDDWFSYFGNNVEQINRICATGMMKFDYQELA